MLSNRINKSLALINEGIETFDVELILEANEEFKSGFDKLKKSIEQIKTIVSAAGLQQLEAPYKDLSDRIRSAESNLDKVPDTYSFGNQEDLAKASEASPEASIASIAVDHDSNISALKTAILGIASFLEGFNSIFSIGKNGIVVNPDFQSLVSSSNPLRVRDFIGSVEDILGAISGVNGIDSLKNHFKPMWDKDGKGEEEDWKRFLSNFEDQEEKAAKAHKDIEKELKNIRNKSDLRKKSPKSGVLGSLFGNIFSSEGSEDSNYDSKLIIGSNVKQEGTIFDLSFEKLQNLIVGILENQESANVSAAAALAGIQSNQEEVQEPSKKQTERAKEFQRITNGNVEQSLDIGAALEDAAGGSEELENTNIEDVDPTKVRSNLKDNDFNEEQIDYTLEELGIEDTADESNSQSIIDKAVPGGESPLDVIAQFDDLSDKDKIGLIDLAMEEDIMDDGGEATEGNDISDVEKAVSDLDVDISDSQASDLVASLLPISDDLQDEVDDVQKYQQIADKILDMRDNPPETPEELEKKIDKLKQVEDKKEEILDQITTLTNAERFAFEDKIREKWNSWKTEAKLESAVDLLDVEGHPQPYDMSREDYNKYFFEGSKYWELFSEFEKNYDLAQQVTFDSFGKINSESDMGRITDELKKHIKNIEKSKEKLRAWWKSTSEESTETNESRIYSRWGRIAGIINAQTEYNGVHDENKRKEIN